MSAQLMATLPTSEGPLSPQACSALFANAPVGLIIVDRAKRQVDINPAYMRLFGSNTAWVRHDLLAESNGLSDLFKQALDGQPASLPVSWRDPVTLQPASVAGTHRLALKIAAFPLLQDGEIDHVAFCFREAFTALKAKDQREQVEAMAHLGHWEATLPAGVVSCSSQTLQLLGLAGEPATLQRDHLIEVIHPDDRNAVVHLVGQAIRNGLPFAIDHRIVQPDGTVRWIRSEAVHQPGNGDECARMIGFVLDITERKATELALAASAHRFRTVVEHHTDAFMLVSADGTILYASEATEQAFGRPLGDLIGTPIGGYIHTGNGEQSRALWQQGLQQPGARLTVETCFQHPDGGIRHFETIRTNHLDDSVLAAVAVSYHDVTERKRQEQHVRQAQMDAVGWLTDGLGHVFTNTLSVVQGFNDLVQYELPGPAQLAPAQPEPQSQPPRLVAIEDAVRHLVDECQQWLDSMPGNLSCGAQPGDLELAIAELKAVADAISTIDPPRIAC